MVRKKQKRYSIEYKKNREGTMSKLLKIFFGSLFFILFLVITLSLSIRGIPGNPTEFQLNDPTWRDQGPFELSPERGRYALLYSLVENHSFQFSIPLAQFTSPDVAYQNGHYVSLFAPTLSFIATPFYMIGKYFNAAQVGSFATAAFFAILNVILIRAIAIKIGANRVAATIASLIFLLATPAFPYAVTLYQHHISTFIILLAIYLLLRFNSVFSLVLVWVLCAISVSLDYPNFFMMLPIGIFALYRTFEAEIKENVIKFKVPILRVLAITAVILPLLFFFWFNYEANGSPTQLSGTLDRALRVSPDGKPTLESEEMKAYFMTHPEVTSGKKTAIGFFKTRLIPDGMYTLFVSPDRGMLVFTPVVLLGFLGIFFAIRRKQPHIAILLGVLGMNILLYAMWDDPYGGWAFGARYLIPGYAMLAVFLSLILTYWKNSNLFLIFFFIFTSYSVCVNTLGALTTNQNPPKIEYDGMTKADKQKYDYTYMRNIHLLDNNTSKSFVYQIYAKDYVSAWNYYYDLSAFIVLVFSFLLVALRVSASRANETEVAKVVAEKNIQEAEGGLEYAV